jgi:phosphohistidine phosphatase
VKVYLVRHGEAAVTSESSERSLTQRGREETERIAGFVGGSGIKVHAIEHSTKLRARQTAEILGARVESDLGVIESEGLEPNGDVAPWMSDIEKRTDDTMIVGHLPFMSKLASALLSGREDIEIVRFTPSSLLCVERDKEGSWHVSFHIHPALL